MCYVQGYDAENGWWCAVIRRAGISLIAELEPLERMMLSPDLSLLDSGIGKFNLTSFQQWRCGFTPRAQSNGRTQKRSFVSLSLFTII